MPIVVRANAKINLHLDIGLLRKDGYHNLKTLFQEISLHDVLTVRPTSDEIKVTASPSHVPQGDSNIVSKALHLLRRKMKIKKGMVVHVQKNIPMGAGLGGGSADAAAALRAAWTSWNNPRAKIIPKLNRVPSLLHFCAASLGADVSFFLQGGTAWAEGKGEKLKHENFGSQRWLVLVYPRVAVSTKEAYQLLDAYRKRRKPVLSSGYFNSFEPVIFSKYPVIREAGETLRDLGCRDVMLSGSGSTVYGFVEGPTQGSLIFNSLQKKPWDVFLAHTVH